MLEPNPGHWAEIVKDKKPLEKMAGGVCHLPISVGRSYYENGAFTDMLYAIKRTFGFCKIHVADTLQARTFCFTKPTVVLKKAQELNPELDWLNLKRSIKNKYLKKAARVLAAEKGQGWVDRNREELESILGPEGEAYTIDYWNDWVEQKEFKVHQEAIEAQYNSSEDTSFKDAINLAAANFIGVLHKGCRKRQYHKKLCSKTPGEEKIGAQEEEGIMSFDPEEVGAKNKAYIKEEVAVLRMWQVSHALEYSKKTDDKKRFIIIYPDNTPAHRCIVDCLNVLPDVRQPLEFFDIAFLYSEKNIKANFQRGLYKIVSHRRKSSDEQDRKNVDKQQYNEKQTEKTKSSQSPVVAEMMSKNGLFQPVCNSNISNMVRDTDSPVPEAAVADEIKVVDMMLDIMTKKTNGTKCLESVTRLVERKINQVSNIIQPPSPQKCPW